MDSRPMRIGLVLLLSLAAASAKAKDERHEHGHSDGGAPSARHHVKGAPETDDDKADGGAAPTLNLTPEQSEFREKLVGQQRFFVRDMVRGHGKHISSEQRQAIERHWHRVMRLLRIRELAEQNDDASVVQHADELRDREDERFVALMQQGMDASAPTPGGGAVK